MVRHACTLFYKILWLFPCILIAGYKHTWASGVLLVLVWIGPFRPHVHSRLDLSSLLKIGLFIDAFTFFLWLLFGVAVLVLGAWIWDPLACTLIHTVTSIYYMYGRQAKQICMYFNHTSLFTRKSPMDPLLLNSSVWKRNILLCQYIVRDNILRQDVLHKWEVLIQKLLCQAVCMLVLMIIIISHPILICCSKLMFNSLISAECITKY